MEQRSIQMFFALLKSAVCGTMLTEEQKDVSPDIIRDSLKIASRHDVAQILAWGLKQNKLTINDNAVVEKHIFTAIYRYERIKYDYEKLFELLEKAQIPFIPLKGSVIRKYYPEPWMRTSCDIDVLVRESDLDKTIEYLIECGYRFETKSSHDASLYSANGTHLELHYSLIENDRFNAAAEVLSQVWDTAVLHEHKRYWYEMPDEMLYFYNIAHIAKHFEIGGCGIRPLVDIWILNHRVVFDKEKRNMLLEKGELLTFAKQVELLSEIWFGTAEHTEITRQMQDYILRGGVYGTSKNKIVVQQQKQGGKLRYMIYRIFPPYKELKKLYPILEKHRWLTPVMEVRRWCKLIFCGYLKRGTSELKYSISLSMEESEFLKNIGL